MALQFDVIPSVIVSLYAIAYVFSYSLAFSLHHHDGFFYTLNELLLGMPEKGILTLGVCLISALLFPYCFFLFLFFLDRSARAFRISQRQTKIKMVAKREIAHLGMLEIFRDFFGQSVFYVTLLSFDTVVALIFLSSSFFVSLGMAVFVCFPMEHSKPVFTKLEDIIHIVAVMMFIKSALICQISHFYLVTMRAADKSLVDNLKSVVFDIVALARLVAICVALAAIVLYAPFYWFTDWRFISLPLEHLYIISQLFYVFISFIEARNVKLSLNIQSMKDSSARNSGYDKFPSEQGERESLNVQSVDDESSDVGGFNRRKFEDGEFDEAGMSAFDRRVLSMFS